MCISSRYGILTSGMDGRGSVVRARIIMRRCGHGSRVQFAERIASRQEWIAKTSHDDFDRFAQPAAESPVTLVTPSYLLFQIFYVLIRNIIILTPQIFSTFLPFIKENVIINCCISLMSTRRLRFSTWSFSFELSFVTFFDTLIRSLTRVQWKFNFSLF